MLRYRINRSHMLAGGLMALWMADPQRPGHIIDLVAGRRTIVPVGKSPIANPGTFIPAGANGLPIPSVKFTIASNQGVEYPNSAARGADPLDSWGNWSTTNQSSAACVFRREADPSAWQGIAVKNRDIIGDGRTGFFVSPTNIAQCAGANHGTASDTLNVWCTGVYLGDGTNRRTALTGTAFQSSAHTINLSGTGAFTFGFSIAGERFSGQFALMPVWWFRAWTNDGLSHVVGHTRNASMSQILSMVEEVRGPIYTYSPYAGIGAAEVLVTVTHTAHGYTTGQKVMITGANEGPYNGIKTITVVDANTYTYTALGNPSTPATGTIKSHRVILDGDADTNGVVQDTGFNYTADIAVSGIVRRASGGTYYKPAPLSGTVGTAGLDVTAFLSKD